jgi:hypothetical protein
MTGSRRWSFVFGLPAFTWLVRPRARSEKEGVFGMALLLCLMVLILQTEKSYTFESWSCR